MNKGARIIPKVNFVEPRRNLPGYKGIATPEDRFTLAFARAYLRTASSIHNRTQYNNILAREIPVNGYGIADIVAVTWQKTEADVFENIEHFVKTARPCTRAFECKLKDWRQAMSQASRYNFFANQAIVVMPQKICKNAIPYLSTFRKIRVGLWGYCSEHDRIYTYHTPRPTKPISIRHHAQAITHVVSTSKQALPFL